MTADQCPCGRPLHYISPDSEAFVRRLVADLGPAIPITIPVGTWLVPRHYVALHGINADELPGLADQFGFTRILP